MADIDIGSAAIDRSTFAEATWTIIDKNNPANASGTIISVQIYAVSGNDLADCEVATFIDEGSSVYSTRDTETIGAVTSGSVQTFPGLDMSVATGDYIGIYFSSGLVELDTSGAGWELKIGDNIPCSSVTFAFYADRTMSLYGEGQLGNIYEISCSDGIKAGDTPLTIGSFQHSLVDSIKLGDTPATIGSFHHILADGVKLGDTALAWRAFYIEASDGVKLGDTPAILFELNPALTDGVKLGDTVSTLLEAYSSISDGLKLGDSPVSQVIFQLSLSDGTKLGDALSAIFTLYDTIADGLKLSDSPSAYLEIYPSISDGIKVGDTLVINIKGHGLLIRVITTKYRDVKATTSKYRDIKATTTGGGKAL